MPDHSGAAVSALPADREPLTDDRLISDQAMAVRAICGRRTLAQLEDMRRSVDRACLMSKSIGWDRRAIAHTEIFGLLADAAGHPVLAKVLNFGVGFAQQFMITAGPAADLITANSRKRLLAFLSADDPEGAAYEMERNLRVLRFMGRLAGCPAQGATEQ